MSYKRNLDFWKGVDLTEEPDDLLDSLMAKANHYLVFAYNCRWNGASGFKIVSTIRSAVSRSYETTQTVLNVSPKGKSVLLHESSHDVPMGAHTVIIGLTEKEYSRLEDEEFDAVQAFADSHIARLV